MQKGRQVPKLTEFTFPDSGITVQLRKVSPLLRDDLDALLRRTNPPPQPPVQTVDTGFGDGPSQQTNEADPDYQNALLKWQMEHWRRVGDRLLDLAIRRYIECDVDTRAVAQLRKDMAALGVDLDPDDKVVYLSRIAIGTREDMNDLSAALFQRQERLREAVDAHKATFPSDLPRALDLENQDGA